MQQQQMRGALSNARVAVCCVCVSRQRLIVIVQWVQCIEILQRGKRFLGILIGCLRILHLHIVTAVFMYYILQTKHVT
jgi:hypothetical protein